MRKRISYTAIGVFLLFAFFVPNRVSADPYQPSATVCILSMQTPEAGMASGSNTATWRVEPGITENRLPRLSFYREGGASPVCDLVFHDGGRRIEASGVFPEAAKLQAEGLLLFPGFPVPCDVLPLETIKNSAGSKIFEIRRTSGGRRFVDRIEIASAGCDLADAVKNGWIQETAGISDDLFWVQATDLRTGAVLVKQLWSSGGLWWLYAETPYCRSWRMP